MIGLASIAEAEAEAPWIAMVHGASQDSRVWDRQVAQLRASCNLLLVDLPGHGTASGMPGPYGHAEMAAHVVGAIETAVAAPAILWGTHTGATVGLLASIERPDLFSALILEGPLIAGRNPPVVLGHQADAVAAWRDRGRDAGLDVWWQTSCWFEGMRRDPVGRRAAEHRAIIAEFSGRPWFEDMPAPGPVPDIAPRLAHLDRPVLIYNGADDHPEFLDAAGWIAERLPRVERASVADAGGFPAWERPAAVAALVDGFLDRVAT